MKTPTIINHGLRLACDRSERGNEQDITPPAKDGPMQNDLLSSDRPREAAKIKDNPDTGKAKIVIRSGGKHSSP